MKRFGLILGTLFCLAAVAPLWAASASLFDGKPSFKAGDGRSYYVWRDGNTWHLRWTTFGETHLFSGSVVAEGGEISSLKRIDLETERRVIAPGRAPHVVVGPRGRVRGVTGGRPAVVETGARDRVDKEGDRRIVFNTHTNDDIDGFDFKVDKDVKALRLSLQIDGKPRPREIEVGSANSHVTADPVVVDLR
jgi:hypothetical protein